MSYKRIAGITTGRTDEPSSFEPIGTIAARAKIANRWRRRVFGRDLVSGIGHPCPNGTGVAYRKASRKRPEGGRRKAARFPQRPAGHSPNDVDEERASPVRSLPTYLLPPSSSALPCQT